MPGWYGTGERRIEITSASAVRHHSGLPAGPIRWVLIRDPENHFEPQALLCTDAARDSTQIVTWFVRRWQVEVTFQEARAHLGVETQRQWADKAIARTTQRIAAAFLHYLVAAVPYTIHTVLTDNGIQSADNHPVDEEAESGTAYAAQGWTSAASILKVASGTDSRQAYVGLTRHRHEAWVVVERERLDAQCRQRQADPRLPATDTAVLERLFGEARRYREKADVIDYATDPVGFVRDGLLVLRERVEGIEVGRATRAARALREAMTWLGLDRLIVPAWGLMDTYGRRLARAGSSQELRLRAKLAHHLGRASSQP